MKKIYPFLFLFILLSVSCAKRKTVTIVVENKSDLSRSQEMVEVDWKLISNSLRLGDGESFILTDEAGKQLPCQLVTYGDNEPRLLIFQATMLPQQKLRYKVKAGVPDSVPRRVLLGINSQMATWENERVAFRLTGGELEMVPTSDLLDGGIEVWIKKKPGLIAKEWYKDGLAGVKREMTTQSTSDDYIALGKSLGAGAAAPFQKDSFYYSNAPYSTFEVLDNGPLRVVFKIGYKPYLAVDSIVVKETRIISLDADANLNKIIEHYGDIKRDIQVAAGFPYWGNKTYIMNGPEGYLAYAQPEEANQGTIYLGFVSDVALIDTKIVNNQMIGIMNYQPSYSAGRGLTYYSGGGWSKGNFPLMKDWENYIINYASCIRHPLTVSVY